MVLYGIRYKEEFNWYNKLMSKEYWFDFKIWIAGFVVAAISSFFRHHEKGLSPEYFSQLTRSWIIVIVFNSIFSKKIHEIDKNDEISNKKLD